METEKTNKQTNRIRKLTREKQALKQEVEKLKQEIEALKQDLYFKNKARPNNHKTVLRVKDIVAMYSVGKSTVWLYAKKKDITPIKNSSRVTTFDAKEVKCFFNTKNIKARDISPNFNVKVAKEREMILSNTPQTPLNKKISKNKPALL